MLKTLSRPCPYLRRLLTIIGTTALAACSVFNTTGQNDHAVYVTQSDFVQSIAEPIFRVMVIFGAYYSVNRRLPNDVSALTDFAVSRELSTMPQNLIGWRIDNTFEKTRISFDAILLSDAMTRTSWILEIDEQAKRGSLGFTVMPTGLPVCITRSSPDRAIDLFVELAIGLTSQSPVPRQTCLSPRSTQKRSNQNIENRTREDIRRLEERLNNQ